MFDPPRFLDLLINSSVISDREPLRLEPKSFLARFVVSRSNVAVADSVARCYFVGIEGSSMI